MTVTATVIPHPHITINDDGSPIVTGTAITVRRLYAWHRQGTTCETLMRRYPALGWAKLLDALAFAHDNADLIVADMKRERGGSGAPNHVPNYGGEACANCGMHAAPGAVRCVFCGAKPPNGNRFQRADGTPSAIDRAECPLCRQGLCPPNHCHHAHP